MQAESGRVGGGQHLAEVIGLDAEAPQGCGELHDDRAPEPGIDQFAHVSDAPDREHGMDIGADLGRQRRG